MRLLRLIICSVAALCLAHNAACAESVRYSIHMRDGVKIAAVETQTRNGVQYVPVSGIVRQVGGGCQITPERAQLDLTEKSAWLRPNNPQVSASLGIFLLGSPVVQSGNEVLIATGDVAIFFDKAFRLAARRLVSAPPAQAPQTTQPPTPPPQPEAPVVKLPDQSELQALEPLETENQLVDEMPLDALEPLQPAVPGPAELEPLRAEMAPTPYLPEPAALEPLDVAKAAGPAAPVQRPLNRNLEIVVIDPGHGGADPGCQGPSGVTEQAVVVGVAEQLRQALEKVAGVKTVFTRERESSPSRTERVFVANSQQGDLLISLHAGTAFSPDPRGCRLFVCVPDGDSAGHRYAGQSLNIAREVGRTVEESTGVACGGIYQVDCQVVQDVAMPGLMVEVGMLTNPEEEKLLATTDYQSKVAAGIANGVAEYIKSRNSSKSESKP